MWCLVYSLSLGGTYWGDSAPSPHPQLLCYLCPPPEFIGLFLSLLGGGIQLPETHLRWELAALWVSRVCTRLLPGTEIASSGKAGGGGLAGRGMDIVPPGGSEGWVPYDLVISPPSQEPKEVPKCHGCRGHGYPHSLAGCPHALCSNTCLHEPG